MIAVVSMPALNQIDIIPGPVWLPQVEKPQERSPPFSDIREAIRQVIWIKGQCVHDPYKAKQRQPQLQPVYTRSADTAVSGGPKNFIFSFRWYGVSFALSRGRSARHSLTRGPARWRTQYHKD